MRGTRSMRFCRQLGKHLDLRVCVAVGGMSMEGQFDRLAANPDILIGTPGRIMHHLQETNLKLTRAEARSGSRRQGG